MESGRKTYSAEKLGEGRLGGRKEVDVSEAARFGANEIDGLHHAADALKNLCEIVFGHGGTQPSNVNSHLLRGAFFFFHGFSFSSSQRACSSNSRPNALWERDYFSGQRDPSEKLEKQKQLFLLTLTKMALGLFGLLAKMV